GRKRSRWVDGRGAHRARLLDCRPAPGSQEQCLEDRLKQIRDLPLKVRKRARELTREALNRRQSASLSPDDMLSEAELDLLRANGEKVAAFAREEFKLKE